MDEYDYDNPPRRRRRVDDRSQDPLGMGYDADRMDDDYGDYGDFAGGLADEEHLFGVQQSEHPPSLRRHPDEQDGGYVPPRYRDRFARAETPPSAEDSSPAMRRARQLLNRYQGEAVSRAGQAAPPHRQTSSSLVVTYFIIFSFLALFLTCLGVIIYLTL